MSKTYMKLDGNLIPISLDNVGTTSKEEQTKTVTPDFSSGNVIVTPDANKVLTQVTVVKDSNLIANNIKNGVTIFGILGTYEGEPSGFDVIFVTKDFGTYSSSVEMLKYSVDSGSTWVDIPINTITVVNNVLTVQLKAKITASNFRDHIIITTTPNVGLQGGSMGFAHNGEEDVTNNVTLTENLVIDLGYYDD